MLKKWPKKEKKRKKQKTEPLKRKSLFNANNPLKDNITIDRVTGHMNSHKTDHMTGHMTGHMTDNTSNHMTDHITGHMTDHMYPREVRTLPGVQNSHTNLNGVQESRRETYSTSHCEQFTRTTTTGDKSGGKKRKEEEQREEEEEERGRRRTRRGGGEEREEAEEGGRCTDEEGYGDRRCKVENLQKSMHKVCRIFGVYLLKISE